VWRLRELSGLFFSPASSEQARRQLVGGCEPRCLKHPHPLRLPHLKAPAANLLVLALPVVFGENQDRCGKLLETNQLRYQARVNEFTDM
jgi:hypothetical protein